MLTLLWEPIGGDDRSRIKVQTYDDVEIECTNYPDALGWMTALVAYGQRRAKSSESLNWP